MGILGICGESHTFLGVLGVKSRTQPKGTKTTAGGGFLNLDYLDYLNYLDYLEYLDYLGDFGYFLGHLTRNLDYLGDFGGIRHCERSEAIHYAPLARF